MRNAEFMFPHLSLHTEKKANNSYASLSNYFLGSDTHSKMKYRIPIFRFFKIHYLPPSNKNARMNDAEAIKIVI